MSKTTYFNTSWKKTQSNRNKPQNGMIGELLLTLVLKIVGNQST